MGNKDKQMIIWKDRYYKRKEDITLKINIGDAISYKVFPGTEYKFTILAKSIDDHCNLMFFTDSDVIRCFSLYYSIFQNAYAFIEYSQDFYENYVNGFFQK